MFCKGLKYWLSTALIKFQRGAPHWWGHILTSYCIWELLDKLSTFSSNFLFYLKHQKDLVLTNISRAAKNTHTQRLASLGGDYYYYCLNFWNTTLWTFGYMSLKFQLSNPYGSQEWVHSFLTVIAKNAIKLYNHGYFFLATSIINLFLHQFWAILRVLGCVIKV